MYVLLQDRRKNSDGAKMESCICSNNCKTLNFIAITPQFLYKFHSVLQLFPKSFTNGKITSSENDKIHKISFLFHCTRSNAPTFVSKAEREYPTQEFHSVKENEEQIEGLQPSVKRQRRRYRKQYPGGQKGITEEMRFVTMKLRNNVKIKSKENSAIGGLSYAEEPKIKGEKGDDSESIKTISGESWQPTMDGFLKYLVDNKLVFNTIERIVDQSSDVSYVYFRKTGLERSDCISKDLEWFKEHGNMIPQPSSPGITYTRYLEELAVKSHPLFLSHFYNIYFSHIAGGQVIAKQVSEKILEGKDLEFYKWEGDAQELLRGVRENINALGEHWSRDEKNKCLRETTKTFRFLGQIVRLIIL